MVINAKSLQLTGRERKALKIGLVLSKYVVTTGLYVINGNALKTQCYFGNDRILGSK